MDSSADSIHPTPDGGSGLDDAGGPNHDRNPTTPSSVITIVAKSDLVLDVTFENTKSTLRAARTRAGTAIPGPKPKSRQAFRVDSTTLRAQSPYFDKLLSDTRFREARDLATAFSNLEKRGLRPVDVHDPADLPWIQILDDDEATGFAHRDLVFAELLKILHRPPSAATPAAPTAPGPASRDGKMKKGTTAASGLAKKKPVTTATAAATSPARSGAKASATASTPSTAAPVPSGPKITMSFVTTLAVLADRFDCILPISRALSTGILRFKWPVTALTPPPVVVLSKPGSGTSAPSSYRDDRTPTMSRQTEDILRQKILVSWLLDQPLKLQAATRELIMNGSCQWTSLGPGEGEEDGLTGDGNGIEAAGGQQQQQQLLPTWWFLRDGLEEELQYRRECILNTIASVQRHFLGLYAARRGSGGSPQCKLGYDSSPSCDSYQLGEMLRFLSHKGLLYMIDFSPSSFDRIPETALLPIDYLLASLRMCPSYQIDKHHNNCGLRTRLLPILDFIQNSLLSAGSVPISRRHWAANRQAASWIPSETNEPGISHVTERMKGWKGLGNGELDEDDGLIRKSGGDMTGKGFRFTRSMALDQRLRLANSMGADKFARDVFTASSWDWTAEDR